MQEEVIEFNREMIDLMIEEISEIINLMIDLKEEIKETN